MAIKKVYLTTVGAGTWTVPADWTNAGATFETIGGGGGGSGPAPNVGCGGEGAHYAKSGSLSLTPGQVLNINIGAGGIHSAPGSNSVGGKGGDTWIGGTSSATSLCGALGGLGGTNSSTAASTATTNDVGNIVVRAGGTGGGIGPNNTGGSGGGGAAGPGGIGGNGGLENGNNGAGGGGAGNTGGAGVAGNNATSGAAGTGGAAGDATAGGAVSTAGSHGSGGGGGLGAGSPGGAGGAGNDSSWDASHGPGGGGGGGGSGTAGNAGAGGLYGGAGAGGAYAGGIPGDGAPGIAVATYTSSIANTTWSPTDLTGFVTLSGGNLTATCGASVNQAGRTTDRQRTGKFYWEVTCTTFASTNSGIGIANPFATMSTFVSSNNAFGCLAWRATSVYINGVSSGVSPGTITSGTVVCIALDLDNRTIAFRLGAGGTWFTYDISVLGPPDTPIYPAYALGTTSEAITANFGDTAFAGAVPSGFTAGFPSGASTPTLDVVSGVVRETLLAEAGTLRASALIREVLRSTSTGAGTYIATDGFVREVLRSAASAAPASHGGSMITVIL